MVYWLRNAILTTLQLSDIIKFYTREAGVRNLEREISKLCRKSTTEIVKGNKKIFLYLLTIYMNF